MTGPALPKDLTAAMAQPLVLAILAREDDYGYGILQKVRALSGGALAWKEGMLYPVLRRLEKEGHVRSAWRTGDNGRRRRYYTLTERGRAALERDQAAWRLADRTLTHAWEGL